MRLSARWLVTIFVLAAAACACAALSAAAIGAGASTPSCAYAAALEQVGERQDAHAVYLQVLARDPSSACARRGAETTTASAGSVWTSAGSIAQSAAKALGAIVLALLLAGVAILLLLQVLTRAPWLRDRWPAKGIRRPVFTVEPLTDTGTDPLGSAVAGLIRGRVTWRTDRFGLNLVSGQAGVASAFSGLGDVSGEAKAAVAIITALTALLPRRRFQLTGQLQPAGEEGVGISLELSQNGDAVALQSFWAASFHSATGSNATSYQHLAVACAAWVDIWMTKALDAGGLLTNDPHSWAFFRSGMDAQRLGDRDRARALYEQALASDGKNVGALANLGIICRRGRQYADAEDYLQRAIVPTEGTRMAPHLRPTENLDWYRIRYQLAALYTNWAADSEPGLNKDRRAERAAAEARELAIITLAVIDDLKSPRVGRGALPRAYLKDTLRPFLKGTIEPSLLTLLAGTVSPLPPRPAGWPGERPTRGDLSASLTANEMDPWQLISYVELGPNRPPETQFNLACFYTRAGDLTAASKRLLGAVRETQRQERQGLVDVALIDPVLRPLLDKRPGLKAKLYEMVDAKAPFEDVKELAQHFDRQDRTISHFQSLGYAVMWNVDTSDIDLTATKGSQVKLIRLPDPERPRDAVTSASGMVRSFEERHADVRHVQASMVLPAINDYSLDALENARHRGMEVLIDTGRGFEKLPDPDVTPVQPEPAAPAGAQAPTGSGD
ncbi:MAG TPA: tetratricopeptide repeat protein [Solirubrobacteraceae bacterium]|nr:tetratricopeptide repeat protein [Solirubrobacteraceae bacterium]